MNSADLRSGDDSKAVASGRSTATKDSIRASAIRHFALHGYHGASVRDIATDAGVQLSSLHYHFGSKQDLFVSTFTAHFASLAHKRLQRLHEVQSSSRTATVEGVLRAFIHPLLALSRQPDGADYLRMQTRALAEDTLTERLFREQILPATLPFLNALRQALPGAADSALYRGYRNMVWGVTFAPIDSLYELLAHQPACPATETGIRRVVDQLVRYHAAGLKAIVRSGRGPKTGTRLQIGSL